MWSQGCNAYRCTNILVRIDVTKHHNKTKHQLKKTKQTKIVVFFPFSFSVFMVSFLFPKTWLLYLTSAILGAGAALIWTGQGNYLSLCSNASNISRNSGVFWAMLQARFVLHKIDSIRTYWIYEYFPSIFSPVSSLSLRLSACWSAIYLYFINSKAKSTSMNQHDALYSLCSFRLQLLECSSFVCCDVSIAVQRRTMQMTDVTENWIINRKRMALLVHSLKPFAYFLRVICCCCASLSFTQV